VKDGEHGDHTRGHAHHKEHQRTEVSDDNRFSCVVQMCVGALTEAGREAEGKYQEKKCGEHHKSNHSRHDRPHSCFKMLVEAEEKIVRFELVPLTKRFFRGIHHRLRFFCSLAD